MIQQPPVFAEEQTYLPVTMQQFEDLTNELLDKVNALMGENKINGDFMASVLMSSIHSVDHKLAVVNKTDLFNNCINRISNQVTFHAVEAIQKKLAEQEAKKLQEQQLATIPPLSVVPDTDSAH